MRLDTICILGGTGFVGRHIAGRLSDGQREIRIPSRRPQRHRSVEVIPGVRLIESDAHDEEALASLFEGCDAVINLIGTLNDSGGKGQGLKHVHVELAQKIVNACRRANVQRLLHMSALGASQRAPSRYQQTKGEAEQLVHAAEDLAVTSFRPSVIFGAGDSFFNRFAFLLRIAPAVFPLPTPQARFAPVYVGDVADAYVAALTRPETHGQSYELCGPQTYTLKELVEYTARTAGIRRKVWGCGDFLSRVQGRVLGLVPGKPYTYDNYLSATVPNVCQDNGLPKLGIEPVSIEAVVPSYLGGHNARGRYDAFRRSARRRDG